MTSCDATIESLAVPHHVHTCSGNHPPQEDHKCPTCGYWWWER